MILDEICLSIILRTRPFSASPRLGVESVYFATETVMFRNFNPPV